MNVGVIIKTTRMGMEHCCHPGFGNKAFVIGHEAFQCAYSTVKEHPIYSRLVFERQRPELPGQSECDEKVVYRQQLSLLSVDPLLCIVVLTAMAKAVATGMGLFIVQAAFVTVQMHLAVTA